METIRLPRTLTMINYTRKRYNTDILSSTKFLSSQYKYTPTLPLTDTQTK